MSGSHGNFSGGIAGVISSQCEEFWDSGYSEDSHKYESFSETLIYKDFSASEINLFNDEEENEKLFQEEMDAMMRERGEVNDETYRYNTDEQNLSADIKERPDDTSSISSPTSFRTLTPDQDFVVPSASLVPAVPSEVDHVINTNTPHPVGSRSQESIPSRKEFDVDPLVNNVSNPVGSRSQESISFRKKFYIDHMANHSPDTFGSGSQEYVPSGKESALDPSVNNTPDTVDSRSSELLPSSSESLLSVHSAEEQTKATDKLRVPRPIDDPFTVSKKPSLINRAFTQVRRFGRFVRKKAKKLSCAS